MQTLSGEDLPADVTDDISLTDLSGVFKKEPVSACVFMNEDCVKGGKSPDLFRTVSVGDHRGCVFPESKSFRKEHCTGQTVDAERIP